MTAIALAPAERSTGYGSPASGCGAAGFASGQVALTAIPQGARLPLRRGAEVTVSVRYHVIRAGNATAASVISGWRLVSPPQRNVYRPVCSQPGVENSRVPSNGINNHTPISFSRAESCVGLLTEHRHPARSSPSRLQQRGLAVAASPSVHG